MEIKAQLVQPFTEEERMNFIVEYNHRLGYEIRYIEGTDAETGETIIIELQAWGYTEEEQLEKAKQVKYQEALQKAYEYQQNGTVEHKNCVFEMSDSNRKNLSDTEEALKLMGQESTTWSDKDDNLVELTINDIQYIRLNLILATIQQLWIVKYPHYKELISLAETVEEVNAIEINYGE